MTNENDHWQQWHIDDVPRERPIPPARRYAMKATLMEEVRRQPSRWRLSRRSATIGAGAAALVLAGGAASAYVAFLSPTDLTTVQCFPSADHQRAEHVAPEIAIVEPTEDGEDPTGPVSISDPVEACQRLWDLGILRTDSEDLHDPIPSGEPRRPAPPLVSCTLERGVAGVFPGNDSTCEQLGLPQTTTTE